MEEEEVQRTEEEEEEEAGRKEGREVYAMEGEDQEGLEKLECTPHEALN